MNWSAVESIVAEAPPETTVGVSVRVVGTGESWGYNDGLVLPAASTIKVTILAALYRDVDAGRVSLDEVVLVDPVAKVEGSGVLTWLRDGLRLPVADLAYLMIAISDNTASNLLMDLVGRPRVQATIDDLGLRDTALNRHFLGRMPDPGMPENLTSAGDLAALMERIAAGTAASAESCARMRATLALQQYRDRLGRFLPEALAFAGKTGSIGDYVHDSGLIETPRGTLGLAVMTKGFSESHAAEAFIGRVAIAAVEGLGVGG